MDEHALGLWVIDAVIDYVMNVGHYDLYFTVQ